METIKSESLSLRLTPEVKNQFMELLDSSSVSTKSDLLKCLIEKYHESNDSGYILESIQPINTNAKELAGMDNVSEVQSEANQQKINISIDLTPAQAFALRETILNEGFCEDVNRIVDNVDNANDTSFFGSRVFSGDFKGIFTHMDLDPESDESINKNIGIALVNHFISSIVFGPGDLNTPVTQSMLKDFLTNQASQII